MSVDSQLRDAAERAIREGRHTRYSLAKQSGVQHATLKRWLDESADIRVSTVNQLAECLGLELRPVEPTKKRAK